MYACEWAYTGDGQVILAGLNPDFVNVNGQKKIIEVFGDYWHGKRATKPTQREDVRCAIFAKYGFRTLVIWEHELDDMVAVSNRIRVFHEQTA